jgi:hypothetical protein
MISQNVYSWINLDQLNNIFSQHGIILFILAWFLGYGVISSLRYLVKRFKRKSRITDLSKISTEGLKIHKIKMGLSAKLTGVDKTKYTRRASDRRSEPDEKRLNKNKEK